MDPTTPLSVTAKMDFMVPMKEVAPTDQALLAALPPDVTPVSASVNEVFPAPADATQFEMVAELVANMTAADLGKFVDAIVAAMPADATQLSGNLMWSQPPVPETAAAPVAPPAAPAAPAA